MFRSVRASRIERNKSLPGDAVIARPIQSLTHAITIEGDRDDVWPWLVQMGAGNRAGWYSYDCLDNGRRPSADGIRTELQSIGRGTLFPALPGVTDGFVVVDVEPRRYLIVAWPAPDATSIVTWAFVLEALTSHRTRLIARARAASGYPFFGMPRWLGEPIVRAVHFVMQRKQLLNIAKRAERRDATLPAADQHAVHS